MTVAIIALLNGKTKDEWYQLVADRVANGDGPVAPPEFGKPSEPGTTPHVSLFTSPTAEHRGPGVHHGFDDSQEDFDMPMDIDPGNLLGRQRPVILLRDGSAMPVPDNDQDSDMFDQDDEDKDLVSQVAKGTPSGSEDEGDGADERRRREETPAPGTSATETETLAPKTHSETASSTNADSKTGGQDKDGGAASADKDKDSKQA